MVCGIHKLTERNCLGFIKSCARAGKRGVVNDGGGLYLNVGVGGTASWIFRYEQDGKRHDMGLGAVHTFSLAEAREAARIARQQLHQGADPLSEKRRARMATTAANPASKPFRFCAEELLRLKEAGWRSDKHRRDWEKSLATYAYPIIGNKLVCDITKDQVLAVLQPHWQTKTETMMRVRGRIELILDWAIAKKFRTAPNPALWKANLDAELSKDVRKATEHFAALDYQQLPKLVADLQPDPRIAAKALLFTVLTVLRSGEIQHCGGRTSTSLISQ